jgi:hypothetical protein|tara:strand:+ start:109 stop:345 length:237 start_codon:yes stop_codon:yes gene_type:complete
MAKSPNTTPINGISYSWTQPYLPTDYNYNPFYQPSNEHKVTEELIRIAAVDDIVDKMLTYPDAERIIKQVMNLGDKDA